MTTLETDVLVVGTGVAGLSTALASKPRNVLLVTKASLCSGSSPLAQGGIAAAVGGNDSAELHGADTRRVGRGLTVEARVAQLVEGAPDAIRYLQDLGVEFDRSLGREAGHTRNRILHAGGDRTGAAIVDALVAAILDAHHIHIEENLFVDDLVVKGGRVTGARAVRGDETFEIAARDVVLATGGLGQIYRRTTNPPEATGDGIAMAARAGARLVDLEFVQFHPTALATHQSPLPLMTEALRGAGAWLVDEDGRRFMLDAHPDGELAPRDVVAREVYRRRAFLDLRPIGAKLNARFPTAVANCRRAGLDPPRDVVPVTAAAHYAMGGVAVDRLGGTSLGGLWACGETAATGVHGANRLASNSLLEALVFGRRLGDELKRSTMARASGRPTLTRAGFRSDSPRIALDTIQRLVWECVGVERDEAGLRRALEVLTPLGRRVEAAAPSSRAEGELRNIVTVGRLVARAALRRRESRGGHYRRDYPTMNPGYARRFTLEDEEVYAYETA